jgi:hypothetical protein
MHPRNVRSIPAVGIAFIIVCLSPLCRAESCDPIHTFADTQQPTRELFVSPAGNDSTGDGTPANPYQSINRALQGVQPGDAIRLLPGTHAPGTFISNLAGTSNAPIWLGGVPGQERPLVSGGSIALQLSRVRFVIVENLEISGASANGINCDDGGDYANTNATRDVLFRNLSFHHIGTGGNQDGLKLSGVYDYAVLDCEFRQLSAGGSGIDHVGCHRGWIARCTFTDAGGNAIQCKGGSADIEIRWNRFTHAGARAINLGGSTGFEFFRPPLTTDAPNTEARNIRVVANLFQGSDTPVAFVGAVDSLVANNTLIQPTRWLFRILQETTSSGGYTFLPCGHNEFFNNLVYFDRSRISTYVNIGANTDAASFQFGHNLWYAFNQPAQSQPTLPAAETNGLYGQDPLFRDAPGGDFSVPVNSPATVHGRRLPGVWADLLERCYANPPSIGAYEANPPPTDRSDADHDLMPDLWESLHGLNRDDPADAALDPDRDRLSNLGESMAGTDPHDAASTFVLRSPRWDSGGFTFTSQTVTGRVYRVESRAHASVSVWQETLVAQGTGEEYLFRPPITPGTGQQFRIRLELEP